MCIMELTQEEDKHALKSCEATTMEYCKVWKQEKEELAPVALQGQGSPTEEDLLKKTNIN